MPGGMRRVPRPALLATLWGAMEQLYARSGETNPSISGTAFRIVP
jgi:hypothetical protein